MPSFAKTSLTLMGAGFGAVGSFLWVNSVLEEHAALFTPHRDANYYLVDAVSLVACGSIGYCLAALWERGRNWWIRTDIKFDFDGDYIKHYDDLYVSPIPVPSTGSSPHFSPLPATSPIPAAASGGRSIFPTSRSQI